MVLLQQDADQWQGLLDKLDDGQVNLAGKLDAIIGYEQDVLVAIAITNNLLGDIKLLLTP
jgi:hypothetical protein